MFLPRRLNGRTRMATLTLSESWSMIPFVADESAIVYVVEDDDWI